MGFFCGCACMRAKSLQSCPTLCDPMDCSPPGSSVHGILQVRILKWVAMPSSRGTSQPRDHVSCIAGGFFTPGPPRKPTLLRSQQFNYISSYLWKCVCLSVASRSELYDVAVKYV